MTAPSVRAMVAANWPSVRGIYLAGIEGGNATFETQPPEWELRPRQAG